MEGISDIKICGLDEMRPPRIRKEPYINLYFKLIHKAPQDWCDDFNRLVSKMKYQVKIDKVTGLFIETWVRKPDEIELLLGGLKEAVSTCNDEYIKRVEDEMRAAANTGGKLEDEGAQGQLNRIIASLNFDD